MTNRHIYLNDIPLDEASKQLEMALRSVNKWESLASESVPLIDALGRITSEPIWAKISSPHYHSAAMDGYAVSADDTRDATETRPKQLQLETQAHPVNTGDPLSSNTNAVIMIEDTQQHDNTIEIRASVAPWQHVRLMGEDMVASELVLPVNHQLRPVDLGALAGCGYAQVNVRRQPNVLLIPTGSELISPTQTPQAGEIIEYNSLVLRGHILDSGGTSDITDIIPDDPDQLKQALQDAISQSPDLICVLSGSSAGSRDFTANIIEELGDLLVHGVAVRPGHPVILGMVDSIPVIGVPGYPVSAALTGELFILPLIRQWLGQETESPSTLSAALTRKLVSPIGDDDFVRVTVAQVNDQWLATPLQRGAGVITSLVRADGLVHIPRFSEGVNINETVEVSLYRPLSVLQKTVMAMGSHDPMLDLLAQHLAVNFAGYRLVSANVGSLGGLIALKRGQAHLAGSHLLDPDTQTYNTPYLARYLPDTPVQLITFAHREQGLMVQQGNPKNIQSLDDLTRVTYVNRQRGAGTRMLLDVELDKRGISTDTIAGYDHEEVTHLAVAAAVASGVGDCGMGVRQAAEAMKLDFISVGWERFDLVIPESALDNEGINHLLSTLRSDSFISELQSQPGYDTSDTGKVK